MISLNDQQHGAEAAYLARFWRSCLPPRLREIGEWAEAEVVLPSGPNEGYEYRLDRVPFARLLLGELGKWERHVITGPTQSGKSLHAFIFPIMYHLFERQEDVIVGVPDMNMAGIKWEDILPVVERSSYRRQLPLSGPGSKGGGKPQKITFANGRQLIFMSAGGKDKQRAGATSRVLMVTESDGLDVVSDASQEGQTKIAQLEGRVRAFENAISFFECTVSTENGFTWREYQAGTASRIMHQCRACREWVSPEREHLIGWQDAQDEIEAAENGRFSCPNCGILYSEDDRVEMNQGAILVHKGQEVTPEGEIVGPAPRTNTLGFRWSAFQNLLTSTAKLSREEWRASQSEDREMADIVISQQIWALPAKNPHIEKVPLNIEIIRGSQQEYSGRCSGEERGQIPSDCDLVTSFIDVSKRALQWSVESGSENRTHVVDYGVHEVVDIDQLGEEAAITRAIGELTAIIQARFPLRIGLVDCGNWRDEIIQAVSEIGGAWLCSHGLSEREHYRHPAENAKDKYIPSDGCRLWYWSLDRDTWIINFNADAMKHRVHSSYQIRPLMEDDTLNRGCVTLFGSDPRQHTEFAKQLTAESYIREFVKGKGFVSRWHKERKQNHFFDTSVGNAVARLILQNWDYESQVSHQSSGQQAEINTITSPDGRPFFVGNR